MPNQTPHQPGSLGHGKKEQSDWAKLPEDQAYAVLAKATAGQQLRMLNGTGPDNGMSNALAAALNRSGLEKTGFINRISPTWYNGLPNTHTGEPFDPDKPYDVNGLPVEPLNVPPYVAKGAKPQHAGLHTGRSQ